MVFMLDVEFGDHLQDFVVRMLTHLVHGVSLPPLPRDGGRADLNAA